MVNIKEVLLYALSITISFLISLIVPIELGCTLYEKDEKTLKEMSKLGRCYIKMLKGFFRCIFFLGSIFDFIYGNLGKNSQDDFERTSVTSFINFIISTGIVTIGFYVSSYFIWGDVFYSTVAKDILENFSNDIFSPLIIIDFLVQNSNIIMLIMNEEHTLLKILVQVLCCLFYIGIIYYGVQTEQVNQLKQAGICRFSLVKSITIKNFLILFAVISLLLLMLSVAVNVDRVALFILILNVYNIEISVTSVVLVNIPVIIEKAHTYHTYNVNDDWKGENKTNNFNKDREDGF